MLTKNDLLQIKELIKEVIKPETNKINSQIRKLRKDLNKTIGFFDKHHLNLEKRIDRIENHLELS